MAMKNTLTKSAIFPHEIRPTDSGSFPGHTDPIIFALTFEREMKGPDHSHVRTH
jgi:hypothetical protein